MKVEQLKQELGSYKRGTVFFAGVALTLLAQAVTTGPQHFSQFWNWYLFWAITQVAVTPLGFVLLVSKDWRLLPLSERLDTAFGHLAVAWLLLLSFLVKSNRDSIHVSIDIPHDHIFLSFLIKSNRDGPVGAGGDATLMLYALVAVAMALAFSYWRLRTGPARSPEEMFP